jgi:hypothetical protein
MHFSDSQVTGSEGISKASQSVHAKGTISERKKETQKMHFAVCFWGLLRALQYTIDSYHEFILKPLDQYNHTYDVIVHTYNFSGSYRSQRNKEESVALNFSNWKLLNPFYLYIENQDDFDQLINYPLYQKHGDPWRNNFSSFQNHVRALNSLYHSTKVAESLHATRQYDGIIYIRPDVKFIQPLPIELLHRKNLSQILFLPDFHRSCRGFEYNDRMAIASVPEGFRYGKKMEIALKYSLTYPLHAEKFTYYHLHHYHEFILGVTRGLASEDASLVPSTYQSLALYEIPYRFRRVRTKGDIHIRDYEAVTPEEQDALVKKGIYFVGKGRQRPWYYRWVYNTIEFFTAYQYYIWNHDDNGNIFCHPHPHIKYRKIKKIKSDYGTDYLIKAYDDHADWVRNANRTHEERMKEASSMHSDLRRIGSSGKSSAKLRTVKKDVVQVAQSVSSLVGNGMTTPSIAWTSVGSHKHWIPMTITTVYATSTGIVAENKTIEESSPPMRVRVYCFYQPIYTDIKGQSHNSVHPSVLRMQQQQAMQKKRLQQFEEQEESADTSEDTQNTKDRALQQQNKSANAHHHQHHHAAVTIPGYSMYLRPVNCTVKAIDESKKKANSEDSVKSPPKRRGGGGGKRKGKGGHRAKFVSI